MTDFVPRASLAPATRASEVDVVQHSQAWEDHAVLERGLEPGPDDDVLSIAGAGCNVLALLLRQPRSITALDVSPAQAALLELKIGAIRVLDHARFLALLGLRPSSERERLYARVRPVLGERTRGFWDERLSDIRSGVLMMGRFDRYLAAFRLLGLARWWPQGAAERLLAATSLEDQQAIFAEECAVPELRASFEAHVREAPAAVGRDPLRLRRLPDGNLGALFWERFVRGCTRVPAADNFYLEFLLTGDYRDLERAHPYLSRRNFAKLVSLVDRVRIVVGELESYLRASDGPRFTRADLSDVFEYASEDRTQRLFDALATRAAPGARIAYWNLLVPRVPDRRSGWRPMPALAESAGAGDRVWFYRRFCVDELAATGLTAAA